MFGDTKQTSNGVETEQELEVEDVSALVAVDDDSDIAKVYEIGYHIVPTIAEDAIEAEVLKITEALSSVGASVIGERPPVSVPLAYAIEKIIEGEKRFFDTGYFGWVAFETSPKMLTKLDETLKNQDSILRFILVKTTKDAVEAVLADPTLDIGREEPQVTGADTDSEGEEAEPEPEKEVAKESEGA